MSKLPSIFAFCPTYDRPVCVANTIKMWEDMTYKGDRELVFLDDGGQYPTEPSGETWSIVSIKKRFSSFGEKQNAAVSFSTNSHDVIVIVEDDDYLAPWTLEAHAEALQRGLVSIPKRFFMEMRNKELRALSNKRQHDAHAGWAFDRHLFRKVGGYPWIDIPTDAHLWQKFKDADAAIIDSTVKFPPYFVSRPFLKVNHLARIRHEDPWSEAERISDLKPIEQLPIATMQRDYVKDMQSTRHPSW